jgi:ATP-dependent helicase HepA
MMRVQCAAFAATLTLSEQQPHFIPGQRWLSDTQSELGLGIVQDVDARCVHMAFPATGETRLYARREAPLTRVRFEAGELIRDQQDRELTVTTVQERDGLLNYLCEDLDGERVELPEAELNDHTRLNRPQQKLLAARLDQNVWFELRYQTWQQGAVEARSPVRGLLGARMGLIPHQLYIASEVAGRYAPRVLLADEVGLGKTIEAGLILHRLLLTGQAQRVLVVVPEPLLHQWLVEMLRRFNLRFSLFDAERFEQADAASGNPFHSAQLVLCSQELLTSRAEVARAALDGEWDMLVVDEAHHLAWSPAHSSLAYDLIEALAGQTPGVLLLTATPEQLGRAGHFGRLRLLDPHRFHDYDAFLAEEQHYAPIAALAGRLLEGGDITADDKQRLAELLGEPPQELDRQAIIDRLVDHHGTGRVLYRNTRAAIQGFPGRELLAYPLPCPEAYAALDAEPRALLTPEREYGPGWTGIDPRLPWLVDTLKNLRPEKVLLICAHADTVLALREALHNRYGIHAAVFHEHMEIVERDRAAAYFADTEQGTQLLICSEIGSEGRNFQFAHHLVLFDLPLDPELLEQRIGRLDRIGQTDTIRIHVPYLQASPAAVLQHWYAEGLGAFQATCPAAASVYEQLHAALLTAMADTGRTDALVTEAAGLTARLNAELESGRDRLLELHSHNPTVSAALVEAIEAQEAGRSVSDYMTRYWDAYSVEHEPGPGQSAVLHPGSHMLHESFPGLPEDGITVTFDRANALAHEDREFLTWEHPMVRGAMDLLSGADLGSAALVAIQDTRLKPGSVLLELIYIAECPAPPELQIGRFLPPTALRLLLDVQGRERGAEFPHDELHGICLNRNRKLARTVIQSQSERIQAMLKQGEQLAQQAAAGIEQQAREHMHTSLDAELARLRQLAALNASVRDDELAHLAQQREALDRQLARLHLRLDAMRLLVSH